MPIATFKKCIGVFVFVFAFYFLHSAYYTLPVYSQDTPVAKTPFDIQFEDYLAKMKVYDDDHSDYVLKRSQYLKFKTLTSQEDAVDSTLAMLLSRNDAVVSYLRTLKEKVRSIEDVPDDLEADIFLAIDDEVEWLNAHKGTTATAGSLSDLAANSLEASKRFDKQKAVFYEALAIISRGRALGYERRTTELFNDLKQKLEKIKGDGRDGYSFSSEKYQILDRWMFDAETRIQRAGQKNLEVSGLFDEKNIKSKPENALSAYNQTLNTLGQSQLYLKEANTFLGEVIRELKIQER